MAGGKSATDCSAAVQPACSKGLMVSRFSALFTGILIAAALAGSGVAQPRQGYARPAARGPGAYAPRAPEPGYGPRGYAPRPPGPIYGNPYMGPPGRGPNSLGGGWREPSVARQSVRPGQFAPLGRVIQGIRQRTPGRQLDAGIEYMGERPVYRVRWMTPRGERIDYIVDAATGAILSGR